jgi:alpha-amylase/alpha-mannosidase (GH57 family)
MDNLCNEYRQICSSETIYSHRKGFFHELCKSSKETIGLAYIWSLFKKLEEDKDSILKMYKDVNISIILTTIANKFLIFYKKKNAINSKIKRVNCLSIKTKNQFNYLLCQINQAVLQAPEIGMNFYFEF